MRGSQTDSMKKIASVLMIAVFLLGFFSGASGNTSCLNWPSLNLSEKRTALGEQFDKEKKKVSRLLQESFLPETEESLVRDQVEKLVLEFDRILMGRASRASTYQLEEATDSLLFLRSRLSDLKHDSPDHKLRDFLFGQMKNFDAFKSLSDHKDRKMFWPENGISSKFKKVYQAIDLFFRSRTRVFLRMQELEWQVFKKSVFEDKASLTALEDVLNAEEKANGFLPVVELEYRSYSGKEFHSMLHRGALFIDTIFVDKNRKGHGGLTHRLQWQALIREHRSRPMYDDDFLLVEVYKSIGDPALVQKLVWNPKHKAVSGLWFQLFDNFGDFGSPEYFHKIEPYWPGLGHWL